MDNRFPKNTFINKLINSSLPVNKLSQTPVYYDPHEYYKPMDLMVNDEVLEPYYHYYHETNRIRKGNGELIGEIKSIKRIKGKRRRRMIIGYNYQKNPRILSVIKYYDKKTKKTYTVKECFFKKGELLGYTENQLKSSPFYQIFDNEKKDYGKFYIHQIIPQRETNPFFEIDTKKLLKLYGDEDNEDNEDDDYEFFLYINEAHQVLSTWYSDNYFQDVMSFCFKCKKVDETKIYKCGDPIECEKVIIKHTKKKKDVH